MKKQILNNYAYLGDYRALAMTYFGRRIILDTRNVQNYQIISHGMYEPAVAWAIEENLKSGDTMLDVGANIGFFTLLANHIVGSKGKVYSFEPNPEIFELMSASVFNNAFRPRSERHNVAAFYETGELELTWSSSGHGGGRLRTSERVKSDEKTAMVTTDKIDNLVKPSDLPVQLIKIDTEGSELFALKGAEQVIKNSPDCKIITEWNPGFLRDRGASIEEAVEFVSSRFKHIEKIIKRGEICRIKPEQLFEKGHSNLILSN